MFSRRIACLFLGIWLGGGLTLFWLGRVSGDGAARILDEQNPSVASRVKPIGREDARLLLHHAVAEQARFETSAWGTAQLFVSALFLMFLLFGTREGKTQLGFAVLLFLVCVFQRFLLTPEVTALGRITDFASAAGYHARLRVIHAAYWGFEFGKWGLQALLAAMLVFAGRRPSGHSGQKLDLVDKADHRHIYR